jgi:hypothetical protein
MLARAGIDALFTYLLVDGDINLHARCCSTFEDLIQTGFLVIKGGSLQELQIVSWGRRQVEIELTNSGESHQSAI